ncbi:MULTISPECIES: hypothetical protein [unclassified Bradyrhizobium]|nr:MULTISPECIES: hypothetical protein [unclassified Bradyrhizobium]
MDKLAFKVWGLAVDAQGTLAVVEAFIIAVLFVCAVSWRFRK